MKICAGNSAVLSLLAVDGREGMTVGAATTDIASGATVDDRYLVEIGEGVYRGETRRLPPGSYDVVYTCYLQDGTTPDPGREKALERLIVDRPPPPVVGANFDTGTKLLAIEASLEIDNLPVPGSDLLNMSAIVYDGDDNVLYTLDDMAPDTVGVFRADVSAPALANTGLYHVKVTISTLNAGVATRSLGLQVA